MTRHMSFMLTKEQVRNRTKTVTRRNGWWNLKPGEVVYMYEKCQGLKKGEKSVIIGQMQVINTRPERLDAITPEECAKEGFPEMTPIEFVSMFCKTHKGVKPETFINRIEFEYTNNPKNDD